MTDPLSSRCETCTLLKVSDDPAAWEAHCSAEIPTNVDYFRTVRMAIPLGRFVSEIDYLKPCPLYAGPVIQSELQRRSDITANYQKSLTKPGNWINRFETALASHPAADPPIDDYCNWCSRSVATDDLIDDECIDCWLERTRLDDIAIEQAEMDTPRDE